MRVMGRFLQRNRLIVFLVLVSIFAWAPLLTSAYFFQAHDAPHSVFFLEEFDQTFQDGYLWPRWAPDFAFGYGYPLFNIYAPLAFYVAEIWHLLGFGFVGSVKLMYVLATLGAGLAMYGYVRSVMGDLAGVLAGVTYVFVPFHLAELFVRSAFPEYVALALLPLVLWAFTALVRQPSPKRVGLAALAYGVLALTHHTTLFTFTPFLMLYLLFVLALKWRRLGLVSAWRSAWPAMAAGVLGACLAGIYLLPLAAEGSYVKVSQWTAYNYAFGNHFVYFAQLLAPFWGYGYSGPGLLDGMPFQLGVVPLALALATAVALLAGRLNGRRRARTGSALPGVGAVAGFFLVVLVGTAWLMSPAADFAWKALPIASLVQFPWRLLGIAVLSLAVLAGAFVPLWENGLAVHPDGAQPDGHSGAGGRVPVELLLLVLVIAAASFAYTLPQYTDIEAWRETPEAVIRWDRFSPADRVAMVSYTDEQPVTSPMEAAYLDHQPLEVAAILEGDGQVKTLRHGGASDEVQVQASGPVVLQFYTYDYPGWQVRLDGAPVPYTHRPPYGLITVDVPAGQHTLVLQMGSTPARLAGSLLSLLSLLAVVGCLVARRIWRATDRVL